MVLRYIELVHSCTISVLEEDKENIGLAAWVQAVKSKNGWYWIYLRRSYKVEVLVSYVPRIFSMFFCLAFQFMIGHWHPRVRDTT